MFAALLQRKKSSPSAAIRTVHQVSSATEQNIAKKCSAPGCKEILAEHNRFHCLQCDQYLCIRHRCEEDHKCVTLAEAFTSILAAAQAELSSAQVAEAQKTLGKVFGNILREPANEKFRTLKKANPVVADKLKHPACLRALQMGGFRDNGEAYVCELSTDLSCMRQINTLLDKVSCAPVAKAVGASSAPATSGGSGRTRLVNGVIVREPAPPEEPLQPKPVTTAAAAALSRGAPAPAPSTTPAPVPVAQPSAAKHKATARDFQRRTDREASIQSQQTALQDIRRQQREKYAQDGAAPAAGAPAPKAAPAAAGKSSGDQCAVQ